MANEKRLIDANALIEYINILRRASKTSYPKRSFVVGDVLDCIYTAPTVAAVEVVHGRWEDEYSGKYANPRYRCSVCKERSLYKSVRDVLGNWKDVQALTNYCPNCGAKMDGDGNG